jgi:predicted DNA-binding transcriptional regulator YafY
VRPHQLVTVGHRWYLVAYDVRRDDWRTFRVDRMVEPALAGVRFGPLDLPAESAAAFVAAGLRAGSEQHEATIGLSGEPAEIERLAHWFRGDLTPQPDGTTRMRLTAESLEWLAGMIAVLSTSFDVSILDAPDEVHRRLRDAADRLSNLSDGGA